MVINLKILQFRPHANFIYGKENIFEKNIFLFQIWTFIYILPVFVGYLGIYCFVQC